MNTKRAHELVDRLGATRHDDPTRTELVSLLTSCAQLAAWVEAARLKVVSALDALAGVLPAHEVASASRTSQRDGQRVVDRAAAVGVMPALGSALAAGAATVGHVDAAAAALGRLTAPQRARLAERDEAWAAAAERMTVGEFRAFTTRELDQVQTASEVVARFERQRRACRFSTWTDESSGMVCGRFELDPERGAQVLGAVRNRVEALFRDRHPDDAPTDLLERHRFLQALAVCDLVTGRRGGTGRAEVIVTVELDALRGRLGPGVVRAGGVDLPVATIRRLACEADVIPAVLDGEGVVLDLGRSRRLASVQQRRALRAMYATCFIPTCDVTFDECQIHHLDDWVRGGRTNLEDLRPGCNRHHHACHEGGWKVEHDGFHDTITLPDGTRLHARPNRRQRDAA